VRIRPVILTIWLAACSAGDAPSEDNGGTDGEDEPKESATVVEVKPIETGVVLDRLLTSASLESLSTAELYPETSGIVRSVNKDDGDPVRKGEVLAVLENVSLDAGAERAGDAVARLQKRVDDARALSASGAISARELADLEAELRTARSTSREAQWTRGNTRIVAPFDGVVGQRDLRVGELATSARKAFVIVDPAHLRAVASMPERDIGRVKIGQRAKILAAYGESSSSEGSITRLAPIVDAASGTFRVTVELVPGDQVLRHGQFVSVEIEVDRHENTLTVPRDAIVWEDGVPHLFRMEPAPAEEDEATDTDTDTPDDGWAWWPFGGGEGAGEGSGDGSGSGSGSDSDAGPRFVARKLDVTLGLMDAEHAEVVPKDGSFKVGDLIVVVGQANLSDGAAIRTPEMVDKAKAEKEAKEKEAKKKEGEGKPEAKGEEKAGATP